MQIKEFTTFSGLEEYAEQWNDLTVVAPQHLPVQSYPWVASYVEHCLHPGEEFHCLLALEGERLDGVLPLVVSPHSIFGMKHPRLRAPGDEHTFSVDFVIRDGYADKVIPAMLEHLGSAHHDRFVLELPHLPSSSPTLSTAVNYHDGQLMVSEFDGLGAVVPITSTFEEYVASMRPNLRKKLRRAERRLQQLGKVTLRAVDGDHDPDPELDLFMKLEGCGWKGKEGTAIEQSERLISFYRSLTRRLASRGWLRWHFLEVNGTPIAGEMIPHFERTLVSFKIGHDEAYNHCSPGKLLNLKTLEYAMNSGEVDTVNWLTDLDWFHGWNAQRYQYFNLAFYPKHALPVVCGYIPRYLRLTLKRVPGLLATYRWLRNRARSKPRSSNGTVRSQSSLQDPVSQKKGALE